MRQGHHRNGFRLSRIRAWWSASRPAPNPAGQYNGLLGGNPNLDSEKGTTRTLGVSFSRQLMPRLAVTVDWWNIKVEDAIQGLGADAILNTCVAQSTATSESPACALINRDPAGSLWLTSSGFVSTRRNTREDEDAGIDFNVAYSHRFDLGGLSTAYHRNGTW